MVGPQERKLSKGQYKVDPNHVLGRDGNYHAYAPVDGTPMEMRRLVLELQSEEFQKAHPVLQASYAHYAFVLIHPFADGNGRVARALASIYTYRDQSVPLLILSEKREEYLNALADADAGSYKPFVDFVLERTLDSIQLFSESIEVARIPSSSATLGDLTSLAQNKDGYTYNDTEKAASNLLDVLETIFEKEMQKEIGENTKNVELSVSRQELSRVSENRNFRFLPSETIAIRLTTVEFYFRTEVENRYYIVVQRDKNIDEIWIMREKQGGEVNFAFSEKPSQLVPSVSERTQMRLSMFVQKTIREMLIEIKDLVHQSLGRA